MRPGSLSDVGLPAQERGALAGATVAGRGGHCEGGVRVVTQVSLSLTGDLAVTAVDLVLQHNTRNDEGRLTE